jgi:hypothetical protein
MHDVFVSHAFEDKAMADAVCATLEQASIRCWIAPRDIPPGVAWPDAIFEAIDGSRLLVLVFTLRANGAAHLLREVEQAVGKGLPILPFRVEDCEPTRGLGHLIGTSHWLDALTPPLESHLKRLAEAVAYLLSDSVVWEPSLTATMRLRLFLSALPVVIEETWSHIQTLERTFEIGGFASELPSRPEVIYEMMDQIDASCGGTGIKLDKQWRDEYWRTGYVRAILRRERDIAMTFLKSADDQLLHLAEVLPEGDSNGRSLHNKFIVAGLVAKWGDTDFREDLIRRCQSAGLLSAGIPKAPQGRSDYLISMIYKPTHRVPVLHRLLSMSGISLSSCSNDKTE